MNWLVKNFLRGIVIVVPVALTLYLLYQAFLAMERLGALIHLPAPGVGVAVLLAAIVAIGALAGNFVGRRLFAFAEQIFTKAPIVRIVYAAIKDLLEAFVGNKRRFDRPVAVEISEGVKAFGFVTREDLTSLALPGSVAVYIPFSYTWDGCLIIVDRARIRAVEADSASVMAMVVSGGVSSS
jgi:uncharacterized membrane protein